MQDLSLGLKLVISFLMILIAWAGYALGAARLARCRTRNRDIMAQLKTERRCSGELAQFFTEQRDSDQEELAWAIGIIENLVALNLKNCFGYDSCLNDKNAIALRFLVDKKKMEIIQDRGKEDLICNFLIGNMHRIPYEDLIPLDDPDLMNDQQIEKEKKE